MVALRLVDIRFRRPLSILLLVCPSPIAVSIRFRHQGGRTGWWLSHGWLEVATACLRTEFECGSDNKEEPDREDGDQAQESKPAPGTEGGHRLDRKSVV